MKLVQSRFAALCAGAVVALAMPALAEPKEGAASARDEAAKHASESAHSAREAAAARGDAPGHADEGREGHEGHEGKGKGKGLGADTGGPVAERIEKMRETRKDRRHARVEELRQKWGEALTRQDFREAIKVHEWRLARLDRIRTLIDTSERPNKAKELAKIDKLIAKENARFDKKMAALKAAADKGGPDKGAPAASAGAPTPAAAPTPPTPTPAAAPKGGAQ